MEYRSSLSWFDKRTSSRRFIAVPFVSKSGKFSIHTLMIWKAYPEQVLFSVISTIYRRLLCILLKRFGRLPRSLVNNCFKAAVYYSINKNDWFIDRFLGISRKMIPKKKAVNFVHYCVSNLDGDKRFVYSQAYQQANWLKFQVFRPSDKSREQSVFGSHLRNNFLDLPRYTCIDSSLAFSNCIQFLKSDDIPHNSRGAQYQGTLGSLDGLSELADEIAGFSEEESID
jgi:hypothetical protein